MRWIIPEKPSAKEVRLAKRFRRGSRFFAFLWEIRGKLFDIEFQELLGSPSAHGCRSRPDAARSSLRRIDEDHRGAIRRLGFLQRHPFPRT